ncbi:MAG TPA: polynucleotide adenylyltransferase PcnB [Steroidobacteraceae bacterium]|nr:polynucleotide adenylyltransferase PcnB [Steroidobacteraceae bacterium]
MNLAPSGAQPTVVPRSEHPISRSAISANALRVLYRLKEGGYQAFLVGGSVRDLLLGLQPKDFDIATNASPDEVRALFRNCRLIGRRFRLAHVYFGNEIVEVATFRAATQWQPEERDEDEWHAKDAAAQRVLDARGRILRDNVYGTIEEDVWRRDFTANALYYNIEDFSVWDFVGGVQDVAARRLRLIGDPVTRYHEDPVRMLRAIRFAAKLGFSIEPHTEQPLHELAYLLTHVPAARLFDETLKLFLSGFGAEALRLLRHYGLLEPLFPQVGELLKRAQSGPEAQLLQAGLESTDARVAADKPVTPTFLFAILFYGPVRERAARLQENGQPETLALFNACEDAVRAQQTRVSIPRRFTLPMREMFTLQPRFKRRDGKKALSLLNHPRFRAAYDLLLLRAQFGAEDPEIAKWWTDVQVASPAEREAMVKSGTGPAHAPGTRRPRRRRRRGRRTSAPS